MGKLTYGVTSMIIACGVLAAGCAESPSALPTESRSLATESREPSSATTAGSDVTAVPAAGAAADWCASIFETADVAGFNQRVGAESESFASTETGTMSPMGPIIVCTGENLMVAALDATDDDALASFWSSQQEWNADFPTEPVAISQGDVTGLYFYYSDQTGLDVELELAQGTRAVTISLVLPLPELDEATAREQAWALAEAALALPLPPIDD